MTRKRIEWKFRGNSVALGERTLIVAVLNVTPDSFSDGGNYAEPDAAVRRAEELQEQGADIIDIGAESTRPGSERVSEAEELRRLIPVLKKLRGRIDIPISVDTYKPKVAENALEYGVSIINDVSALTWEPELVKPVLQADAGLILSHTRGTPDQWARMAPLRDVMGEIGAELEASVHRARRAGIPVDHIIIDPGIGFGKRREQNAEIVARLAELQQLNLPILIGPSRKSFLAQEDPRATEFATAAAVTASVLNGARLVRVHDVAAMRPVVAIADAVVAGIPEPVEEQRDRRSARDARRELEREDEERKRPIRPPTVRKAATPPPEAEDAPPQRPEPYRRDREESDRPPRKYAAPPRREGYQGDRPPRKFAGPPRRDEGDRPPRKYAGPPRRDEGDRPPRKFAGPARRDEGDRPPRKYAGSPRRDEGDRPPRKYAGPPRRDEGDRPPRKYAGSPRRDEGDRPPRKFAGPPRRDAGDRPPRKFAGPARGRDDRPPSRGRDDRPPRRGPDDRPPRRGPGDRPPRGRGPSTPRRRG